jgi:pyruvate dehydrogenase kinase 2/3/4
MLKLLTAPYLLHSDMQSKLEPISRRILGDIDILMQKLNFTDQIRQVRRNHDDTMKSFAEIVKANHLAERFPTNFLESFYVLNMSSRLLMDEHLSLADTGKNLVQMIDPVQVAVEAAQKSRKIAESHSIDPPNISIINVSGEQLSTLYIHEHLQFILIELLKNAIASSAQCLGRKPNLNLMIASGSEDVTFHVSDEAGGMPLKYTSQLWNLEVVPRAPFARGLPLCRVMARYFGGDLEIIPMDGHGTNAYLHLFKQDSLEHIPEISPVNKPVIDQKSKSTSDLDVHGEESWLLDVLNK